MNALSRVVLVLSGCGVDAATEAVRSLPADSRCPPGMVLVEGSGTLGVDASRFAVVSTMPGAAGQAPEAGCDNALSALEDPIGCWVQTDQVDPVLPPRRATVAPVCVDALPFPGGGAEYTTDGMTAWDAALLQELFAGGRLGGRRLCTATELQAAVAGLSENRPIVFGGRDIRGLCPAGQPIGADPRCENPATGVAEYAAVHGHWVVADAAFVAHACASPPCKAAGNRPLAPGMLVVLGGTDRVQTRQAPRTPHTWHDHGRAVQEGCEAMGHDDQPAVCATPDPGWGRHEPHLIEGERRWRRLEAIARESGRMQDVLDAGLGRDTCPSSVAHGL